MAATAETRTYRFGPLALQVALADGPLADAVDAAWGGFRGVPPGEVVQVEVTLRPGAPAQGPRPLPRVAAEPGGGVVLLGDDWEARVSPDGARVALASREERFPLEATAKVLLARALRAHGGLLLHGAAVAHAGGAAVFVAASGGGKSTLASCAARGGLGALADELVAVFPIQGAWWAYGTPWNVGTASGAPLRAVGILAWSEQHRVTPAAPSEVLRVLAENALLADDAPQTRRDFFAAAEALLAACLPVRLAFAPRPDVAALLGTLCGGSPDA